MNLSHAQRFRSQSESQESLRSSPPRKVSLVEHSNHVEPEPPALCQSHSHPSPTHSHSMEPPVRSEKKSPSSSSSYPPAAPNARYPAPRVSPSRYRYHLRAANSHSAKSSAAALGPQASEYSRTPPSASHPLQTQWIPAPSASLQQSVAVARRAY